MLMKNKTQRAAILNYPWDLEQPTFRELPWPPRSYTCSFCRREFQSAQALGGHMNVHRRDRARLKQSSPPQEATDQTRNVSKGVSNPNHESEIDSAHPQNLNLAGLICKKHKGNGPLISGKPCLGDGHGAYSRDSIDLELRIG